VNKNKKLILAFPPFSMVTSPPLGICALKGYIEKTLADWSVQTVDLNLLTHDQIFDLLSKQPFLDKQNFKEGTLGEIALSRAVEVFHEKDNFEFYHRPDRYTVYADLMFRLINRECMSFQVLKNALKDKVPIPNLILEQAQRLLSEKPDVIGLSICYSQQLWLGLCLGKALKKHTSIPIIYGGTSFTENPAGIIQEYSSAVDYIISGEGEISLAELLKNLDNPGEIAGLTYIKNNKVVSFPQKYEEDLDSLGHPDFSDLSLDNYYSPETVIPVLTSRGCYWRRCAFCVHYKSAGQTYRTYSVEHILEELNSHVQAGIKYFAFIDEMISPAHFSKLADGIISAGLDINYYALAKPVKQFDSDLLRKMRESGCRYILWGLESGNQRILDLMQKGTIVSNISKVLQNAHQAGIFNHAYIMIGFPTETREEFGETLQFLDRHKHVIFGVHRSIFHLEKGSPVFDDPQTYSIKKIQRRDGTLSPDRYHFECETGMNSEEIKQNFAKALPFLRAFNPYSPRLGNYRDHALLIYSCTECNLAPERRVFPRISI
jgi:anaerobic magnesium-protoporphyrin IX monomethyl ester cyclase